MINLQRVILKLAQMYGQPSPSLEKTFNQAVDDVGKKVQEFDKKHTGGQIQKGMEQVDKTFPGARQKAKQTGGQIMKTFDDVFNKAKGSQSPI